MRERRRVGGRAVAGGGGGGARRGAPPRGQTHVRGSQNTNRIKNGGGGGFKFGCAFRAWAWVHTPLNVDGRPLTLMVAA